MISRLAIVGAGAVIKYHIEAFLHAGVQIVGICATENSKNARNISNLYNIPYFSNVSKMISGSKADGYLISVDSAFVYTVLTQFSNVTVPILIEKPGFTDSIPIEKQLENSAGNRFVAFNRRHYESVVHFKSAYDATGGFLEVDIVENADLSNYREVSKALINNSCHIIDLVGYLCGPYQLQDFQFSTFSNSFHARIYNNSSKILGNLNIYFNSPINISIKLYTLEAFFQLKPIEVCSNFNQLKVKEPTSELPIRIYEPTWSHVEKGKIICDSKFKPGFLNQALNFLNCENEIKDLCTLEDSSSTFLLTRKISSFIKSYL
jgi:hypothetical protein